MKAKGSWKLSSAQKNKIIKDYQSGMSLAQAGKPFHVSRQAVQQMLIARGIPRRS